MTLLAHLDLCTRNKLHHIYHKYRDRQAWTNNVDPDHTPVKAQSGQGLHYDSLVQSFLTNL